MPGLLGRPWAVSGMRLNACQVLALKLVFKMNRSKDVTLMKILSD